MKGQGSFVGMMPEHSGMRPPLNLADPSLKEGPGPPGLTTEHGYFLPIVLILLAGALLRFMYLFCKALRERIARENNKGGSYHSNNE